MVTIVRWLMILTAIVLAPVYGLWICGGALADAKERGDFDLKEGKRGKIRWI